MLLSAIIFGLLGSFHCLGMCGPIAFMLPVDREKPIKRFLHILSYHLGRIFTYAIIGILFGILGKGFYLFGFLIRPNCCRMPLRTPGQLLLKPCLLK